MKKAIKLKVVNEGKTIEVTQDRFAECAAAASQKMFKDDFDMVLLTGFYSAALWHELTEDEENETDA